MEISWKTPIGNRKSLPLAGAAFLTGMPLKILGDSIKNFWRILIRNTKVCSKLKPSAFPTEILEESQNWIIRLEFCRQQQNSSIMQTRIPVEILCEKADNFSYCQVKDWLSKIKMLTYAVINGLKHESGKMSLLCSEFSKKSWRYLIVIWSILIMAIRVVVFSNGGYKIRKVFA